MGRDALANSSIGAWAEYATESNGNEAISLRYALTTREGGLTTIEYGQVSNASQSPNVTMRATFGPLDSLSARPRLLVGQVRGFLPIEQKITEDTPMRTVPTAGRAELVGGRETIDTPVGTFIATHCRQRFPDGAINDYWLSKEARPVGLVRLREVAESGQVATTTLVKVGAGASSQITAPARPNDDQTFAGEMVQLMTVDGLPKRLN